MKLATVIMTLVVVTAVTVMGFQPGPVAAQEKILQRVAEVETKARPFWESKARAEQGDPVAQYEMGRRYELGDGVPREIEKAHVWYLKAARQGNVWAQNNLGRLYGEGEGVAHDYITAHMWFVIASKGGSQIAKSNGKYTRARMTTLEARKARGMAEDWLTKHPGQAQTSTDNTPLDG